MNMFYSLFFYQVEVLISCCRFVWVLCTDLHKLRESTIGEESNLQWKMLTSKFISLSCICRRAFQTSDYHLMIGSQCVEFAFSVGTTVSES